MVIAVGEDGVLWFPKPVEDCEFTTDIAKSWERCLALCYHIRSDEARTDIQITKVIKG